MKRIVIDFEDSKGTPEIEIFGDWRTSEIASVTRHLHRAHAKHRKMKIQEANKEVEEIKK